MVLPFSAARIAGAFTAHPPLSDREAAWLGKQGVAASALRMTRSLLFLVTDSDGEAVDLVGWQPRTGQLGSWRGYAWGLGQEDVFLPRFTDHDGLHVWRTPLEWLQAARRGVVIFRPRLAAELLADAGPLIAMDLEHGEELRAALQRPGPRNLISAQARRAA